MTRDTAVQLARQALANESIQGFEFLRAAHEIRDSRTIWLVIFALKEEPGVVTTPDTVFVEVDEGTEAARVIRNP